MLVIRDRRERQRWGVLAFARDAFKIEAQYRVGVADELEPHLGCDVRVGDAGVNESERAGEVEIVGEAFTKELVPPVERDASERVPDSVGQDRPRSGWFGVLG